MAPPTTSANSNVLQNKDARSNATANNNEGLIKDQESDEATGDFDLHAEAADDKDSDDDAEREFVCVNDEFSRCKTGQYTLNLARKVISDHFGRNKACTKHIKDWPLFCRMHYQRATYNQQKWQLRKIDLILRQLEKIEEQLPGTLYTVALKKSEEHRLNVYSRKVAAGLSQDEAAQAVEPKKGKHFEAPVDVLRELETGMGSGHTREHIKELVLIIGDMLEKGETAQVPSIEFLPEIGHLASGASESASEVNTPLASGEVEKTGRSLAKRKTAHVNATVEGEAEIKETAEQRITEKGKVQKKKTTKKRKLSKISL